jgi:alkylation response protein AidB-like acyl-CoA dehydrogenase
MQFSFTPDQYEFAAGLREMLEREFTAARLRHVWESGDGHDAALWSRLAEMGVLSMMVPEADGGLGGDFVDTVLLVEELGRAAVPGPVVETMVVGALALAGTKWSAGIVDGSTPVTAALLGERYVPHATTAPLVLVAHGGSVELLDHPALTDAAIEGIDGGRRLSALGEAIGGATVLDADLGRLIDAGALSTAAYLLGLSSRTLAIAGDYARDRRQFGQPIGAFQAVKHLMADALLKVEFARPAIYRAAWSFANDTPESGRDVSMAKALVSDAALKAARSALQVHGAIGYTWECDLQLFMKKAWALAPAWGSAQHHRRRVADAVLGPR